MSLINDALKRAESEKRAAQSSASTPPLQPVESGSSHSTSPLLLGGIFLLGLGTIAIAAALWFGGRKTEVVQVPATSSPIPTDRSAQVSTDTQPTLTTTTSTPVAIASAPQQPTPKPIAVTTPPPTTAKSTAPLTPTANTTAAPQTKPIRLQSIFYRLRNPTVIINGKTLGVGDTLDGIKVVSIQRSSAEIVQNGKYRTLTLQD